MQNDTGRAWRIVAGAAGTAIAAYGMKRLATRIAPTSNEGEHVVTIRKSPGELHALWTNYERAPEWMYGVQEVTRVSPGITHWVVAAPGGGPSVEYNTEVIDDVPGARTAWKTTDDSTVRLYCEAQFIETSRGTELRCTVAYDAPIGLLGVAAAGMAGVEPTAMLKEHLRRFKMLAEAGEVATNAGPSARRTPRSEPGTLWKRGFDVSAGLSAKKVTQKTRAIRREIHEGSVP